MKFDRELTRLNGWRDAKAHAEASNWKLLATGDWSWVFAAAQTDIVWRITPFDPAFDVFATICSAHPGNPHLPTVAIHHAHATGGTTTVMERLHQVDRVTAEQWFADLDAGSTLALEELQQIVTDPNLGSEVSLFAGVDLNPANVLRRPSDGHLVFTDAFWINGPELLTLIRSKPEQALRHYSRDELAEWAHLPCMDAETTALILRAITTDA